MAIQLTTSNVFRARSNLITRSRATLFLHYRLDNGHEGDSTMMQFVCSIQVLEARGSML